MEVLSLILCTLYDSFSLSHDLLGSALYKEMVRKQPVFQNAQMLHQRSYSSSEDVCKNASHNHGLLIQGLKDQDDRAVLGFKSIRIESVFACFT